MENRKPWQRKSIPMTEPFTNGKELANVIHAMSKKEFSWKGGFGKEFETKFAGYNNCKYVLSTSSGTTALHLALLGVGIKPGDEVITPTLTYAATNFAISYCGAKPVFVDSSYLDWNINVSKIEEKITAKTKAIMVVHLYGNPVSMPEVMLIAKKHSLAVIEDCAEAIGAEIRGQKVGTFGDVGCFSFYGNKVITCGEGGAVITNNKSISKRMDHLRNGAMVYPYYHSEIGYNYRLNNISSGILVAQLETIAFNLNDRQRIRDTYNKYLLAYKLMKTVKQDKNVASVCWLFSVLVESRDGLIKSLKENKIDSRPFFMPNHLLPSFETKGDFLVAEDLHKRGINLPTYVEMEEEDIKFVCTTIRRFYD